MAPSQRGGTRVECPHPKNLREEDPRSCAIQLLRGSKGPNTSGYGGSWSDTIQRRYDRERSFDSAYAGPIRSC